MNQKTFDSNSIRKPFIIRGALTQHHHRWPSIDWTLDDWSKIFGDKIKLKFRVHHKQLNNYWENEATDIVLATMKQFIDFIQSKQSNEQSISDLENPFRKYSSDDYCFYSSYNHLNEMNLDSDCETILNASICWNNLDIFQCDSNKQKQSFNTTLWIGTGGSCTPLHQDTYGYNFIAQLHGRKQWTLFQPNDAEYLYPKRLPYEESSIFSRINFKQLNRNDIMKYKLLHHCQPYCCIVNAGDLLYVPYHWWHFVENLGNSDSDTDVSISANVWIDPISSKIDDQDNNGNDYRDQLKESITQLLFSTLYKTIVNDHDDNDELNIKKWSNESAENLMNTNRLLQAIKYLSQNHKPLSDEDFISLNCYKKSMNFNENSVEFLQPIRMDEYLKQRFESDKMNLKRKFEENEIDDHETKITTEDIINSILDMNVIDLIVEKILRRRRL